MEEAICQRSVSESLESEAFENSNLLDRHRMIYNALDEMMRIDIHALAIDAWSPEELDR